VGDDSFNGCHSLTSVDVGELTAPWAVAMRNLRHLLGAPH